MDSGNGNLVIGGRMLYHRSGGANPKLRRLKIKSKEPPKKEETEEVKSESRDRLLRYKQQKQSNVMTTQKQLQQLRQNIKSNLPMLTDREIRRNRISFYEAMCIELEEDGFHESADYIQQLINLNNQLRKSGGENSIIWQRPVLKSNNQYLDRLRTGLVEAEKARKKGDLGAECSAFLDMAIFFMNKRDAWWWVAEQLFLHCVQVASLYRGDGGWREACSRYLYGKFLQEQLADFDEAKMQLQLARDLSTGKEWSAAKELGYKQGTIYLESCTLLYQALLRIGIEIRPTDPYRSVRLCTQALRRAIETNKPESEADVLLELGISYQVAGEYTHSMQILEQYIEIATQLKDVEGQCGAYLEFAICHKALQDSESTLQYLEKFLRLAEQNHMQVLTAAAHRYLGECHLNLGSPEQAGPHLMSAFSIYFKLGMTEELDQTRTLAGIAAGQEILPDLIDLILSCDHKNQRNLVRLINWKGMHIPFLEGDDESIDESLSGIEQEKEQEEEQEKELSSEQRELISKEDITVNQEDEYEF